MTDDQLLQFTTEFREGVLDGTPSWMMCFMVCAPLTTLLEMHGVENTMVEGDIEDFSHVWLSLPDGRVLDPTADQFNEEPGFVAMPPVYLGPPTSMHANPRR